jgi:hypothetical protein
MAEACEADPITPSQNLATPSIWSIIIAIATIQQGWLRHHPLAESPSMDAMLMVIMRF